MKPESPQGSRYFVSLTIHYPGTRTGTIVEDDVRLAWKGAVSEPVGEFRQESRIAPAEAPAGLAGDATAARWVGERMPRVEDQRMITGHGRYVDDLAKPGMVHATFVRSTVARGRITGLDVSEARRAPGVIAVLTAAEVNPRVHQLGRTVPGRGPTRLPGGCWPTVTCGTSVSRSPW